MKVFYVTSLHPSGERIDEAKFFDRGSAEAHVSKLHSLRCVELEEREEQFKEQHEAHKGVAEWATYRSPIASITRDQIYADEFKGVSK